MSFSWGRAASELLRLVAEDASRERDTQQLDDGQRASLAWMSGRLPQSGVVLADEVGTGKTRIACAVVQAVVNSGGRAAVVVPHGLMHQWQHEAQKLGMRSAKSFTTLREFVEDAKTKSWEEIAPAPTTEEWLLVSHGFRAPQVRQGKQPAEWRVALPSYVRAEMTSAAICRDGRTLTGRLLRKPHETTRRIAADLTARVHGQDRVRLRARLDRLPTYRRRGDNKMLTGALQGDGRVIMEELLGRWLGEFDLLVIDEAHKSRGEAGVENDSSRADSSKVLPRLLDSLLRQTENGRRLCLTATPMELELAQWLDLLVRSRCDHDRNLCKQLVERLYQTAQHAMVAPDEGRRLDDLCSAAKAFSTALAPYITRRRRDQDALVSSFREATGRAAQPHAHRRSERVLIGWEESESRDSPWFDVLFAAECMSQSARGLKLEHTKTWPRVIRDAYTKLSAGHVSIDLSGTSKPLYVPEPGEVDDHTHGKMVRTAYWYQRLRDSRKRVPDSLPHESDARFTPDAEHPRILAAVKEIEHWTQQREKVLVFGVFLRPLRLLRDVLNVRQALRMADVGRPIVHSIHTDPVLRGLAHRELERLRAEGALSGRLAAENRVDHALAESHKAYDHLRSRVRERANKQVANWCIDPTLLGGAPVDARLASALRDHLVSFAIDDALAKTEESDDLPAERFEYLTREFVAERLRPLVGELGGDDVNQKQAVLRQKAIRTLIGEDNGLQSRHARLLDGRAQWQTRRYLQAAFNRPDASPRVLIAQSQVGREGLNLHEACRVVVQFHAEWNPAVVEQQIGRVDRKGSLWERLALDWLKGDGKGQPPFVEIRQLIFEGTYDAFQWERVTQRQHAFDASLFGRLLPAESWERVPEDRRADLIEAAPDFRPPKPE